MAYHELIDWIWRSRTRWYLGDPIRADTGEELTWAFSECRSFGLKSELTMPITEGGDAVDITIAGIDTPVLSERAFHVLSAPLAEFCEFIPVKVATEARRFAIMNVLHEEDCVSEEHSELLFFGPDDGRPDKIGEYLQITKLVLKATHSLAPIFRLKKFKTTLLVREDIASLITCHRLTGVVLEPKKEIA